MNEGLATVIALATILISLSLFIWALSRFRRARSQPAPMTHAQRDQAEAAYRASYEQPNAQARLAKQGRPHEAESEPESMIMSSQEEQP